MAKKEYEFKEHIRNKTDSQIAMMLKNASMTEEDIQEKIRWMRMSEEEKYMSIWKMTPEQQKKGLKKLMMKKTILDDLYNMDEMSEDEIKSKLAKWSVPMEDVKRVLRWQSVFKG